jgi:FtsZ-binding cell division protein ZapB
MTREQIEAELKRWLLMFGDLQIFQCEQAERIQALQLQLDQLTESSRLASQNSRTAIEAIGLLQKRLCELREEDPADYWKRGANPDA